MKLFRSLLLLATAGAAALPACKPDTARTATEAARNPASLSEVRAQLDILRDSADGNWQRMMVSDDKKLTDIKGLLTDLTQVPGLNTAQVQQLRQQANELHTQRYTRETLANSALIDHYDAAQDSVLHHLYPLAAPAGNAPSAQIRDYVEAIQLADANVVVYRAHYDRAAKAFNAYIEVHHDELQKMGRRYADLVPLPIFELSH